MQTKIAIGLLTVAAALCTALMTLMMLPRSLGHAAAQVPHTLYVANQMADTISVVDGATFVVVATIPTGRSPHEILVDVSKGVAYVSNRSENTVSVMDLRSRKELARIPAPDAPHGLALSADGATLFSTGRQEINVIDLVTRQRVGSIPVGQRPHMLRRSPDKMRLNGGTLVRKQLRADPDGRRSIRMNASIVMGCCLREPI